ncbi:MAG: S8 family serine peptidase, partial [Methanobacteriota archaeon]
MNRALRHLVTVLIVLLTAASAFAVAFPEAASPDIGSAGPVTRGSSTSAAPEMADVDAKVLEYLNAHPAAPDYLGKMSPTIRAFAAGGEDTVRAVVATDDVVQLGTFLRSAGLDTRIGSVETSVQGLRAVVVDVPAVLLAKIAALDRVVEIAPAVQAELPQLADPDVPGLPGEGPAPTLIEAGKGHHVPDAWALGYTGAGIRVAPMDSGTDFGHPDLQGTFARVTDPASPYFNSFFGLGWPMAFDTYSMEVYVGLTAPPGTTFPAAPLSWYVDTSFTTTADPMTGLLTTPFMGRVYNVSGIPSASGVYHVGLHPDRTLRFSSTWKYYQFVGLLVTDSFFPGVYDTVYVDLDHDKRFWDDKPANIFSPEIWADYYNPALMTWDNTTTWLAGDGIADMSGGMVYFISNGVAPVPYSDNIATWYGFGSPPIPGNGNLVALQIGDVLTAGGGDHGTFVASSIVAQNVTGTVQGFAPDAELISVGNVYASALLFYDMWRFVGQGYDSVPGTGDEADIASASFGFSGTYNDGFDFASRWADLWSLINPNTAFLVSSGNGGHGFGTVTAPGTGFNMLTVGASTSYSAATPFPVGASDAGAHSTFGDVQPWSNRGPSTLGQVKPDVVTVGAWASGDGALNAFGGRTSPWAVWGGTSLSAPATAGILALVKQAFFDTFGPPMEGFLSKAFLMAGADNIHYDPLAMGAGLTNASKAVRIAGGIDGLVPIDLSGYPASQWPAGDFRGVVYPAFPRLMYPGTTNTTTFGLGNVNFGGPKNVTISDWTLERIGTDSWTITTTNTTESAPDFLRPDYLIDLTGLVPPGTALLKATVSFPFAQFDPEVNYAFNSRWRVLLYNWKDYDANGSYWTDANGNGVVNAGEMDATMGAELQRFTYGYPSHTNIQAYVHDPLARIDDGLLLGIQHRTVSTSVPTTTLTVTVEYYAAVDAPWLSASPSSMSVPCCAPFVFAPITLTATLPAGTPAGILTAIVTISNATTGDVNIPVIVNVARTGPGFTFGGDPIGTAFYDNSRMFGGVDWAWRAESGDWRFYWTDVPDTTPIGPGDRLLAHTWWTNAMTDIDTFVLGPSPDDCFIYPAPCFTPSPLFGPYSLNIVGQSSQRYLGSGRWRFQTATGGPEEWVSAPLSTGLHGIALHNVMYAGAGPSEVFSGEVGTFRVTPNPWSVTTPNATGSGAFTVNSSIFLPAGLDALAFGLSQPSFAPALPIVDQGTYIEQFNVSGAGLIEATIDDPTGTPGMDLDLYLERWTGTVWGRVTSSEGPTAFETLHVTLPLSGLYRVRVFGFAVPGGAGVFELFRLVVQGTDLTPTGVSAGPIPGGTATSFNVSWNVATTTLPGFYVGIVFVGPDSAPTTVEILAPFILTDERFPTILDVDPAPGSSLDVKNPTVTATYVDDPITAGIGFALLGIDGLFLPPTGGFNATQAVFSFPFELTEGAHTFNVSVFDFA